MLIDFQIRCNIPEAITSTAVLQIEKIANNIPLKPIDELKPLTATQLDNIRDTIFNYLSKNIQQFRLGVIKDVAGIETRCLNILFLLLL